MTYFGTQFQSSACNFLDFITQFSRKFVGKPRNFLVCPDLSSLGVPGVPWHTQILADQLTLFQLGGTDYAHLITTGTPEFSDLPTALLTLVRLLKISRQCIPQLWSKFSLLSRFPLIYPTQFVLFQTAVLKIQSHFNIRDRFKNAVFTSQWSRFYCAPKDLHYILTTKTYGFCRGQIRNENYFLLLYEKKIS